MSTLDYVTRLTTHLKNRVCDVQTEWRPDGAVEILATTPKGHQLLITRSESPVMETIASHTQIPKQSNRQVLNLSEDGQLASLQAITWDDDLSCQYIHKHPSPTPDTLVERVDQFMTLIDRAAAGLGVKSVRKTELDLGDDYYYLGPVDGEVSFTHNKKQELILHKRQPGVEEGLDLVYHYNTQTGKEQATASFQAEKQDVQDLDLPGWKVQSLDDQTSLVTYHVKDGYHNWDQFVDQVQVGFYEIYGRHFKEPGLDLDVSDLDDFQSLKR